MDQATTNAATEEGISRQELLGFARDLQTQSSGVQATLQQQMSEHAENTRRAAKAHATALAQEIALQSRKQDQRDAVVNELRLSLARAHQTLASAPVPIAPSIKEACNHHQHMASFHPSLPQSSGSDPALLQALAAGQALSQQRANAHESHTQGLSNAFVNLARHTQETGSGLNDALRNLVGSSRPPRSEEVMAALTGGNPPPPPPGAGAAATRDRPARSRGQEPGPYTPAPRKAPRPPRNPSVPAPPPIPAPTPLPRAPIIIPKRLRPPPTPALAAKRKGQNQLEGLDRKRPSLPDWADALAIVHAPALPADGPKDTDRIPKLGRQFAASPAAQAKKDRRRRIAGWASPDIWNWAFDDNREPGDTFPTQRREPKPAKDKPATKPATKDTPSKPAKKKPKGVNAPRALTYVRKLSQYLKTWKRTCRVTSRMDSRNP
jgi:hypothetical protein